MRSGKRLPVLILLAVSILSGLLFYLTKFSKLSSTQKLETNCKYGCINGTGQVVIKPKFDRIDPFKASVTIAVCQGMYRLIDKNGKYVSTKRYQLASSFSEGLAAVCTGNKWGYVDETGSMQIPCMYDRADAFAEGLASVSLDGKTNFIDKNGKTVFRVDSCDIGPFREGLACTKREAFWAFVDPAGHTQQCKSIEEIYPQNGSKPTRLLAALATPVEAVSGLNGASSAKWGLIDNTGSFIVNPQYSEIPSLTENRILLVNDKTADLLDMNANRVASFDSAFPRLFEVAIVKVGDKWGVVDLNGKFLIEAKYDEVRRLDSGFFLVKNKQRWELLDSSNAHILEAMVHPERVLSQKKYSRDFQGHWQEDPRGKNYCFNTEKDSLQSTNTQDKWGAFDGNTGVVVIPCLYDRPIRFDSNGLCLNSKDNHPVLLDRRGRETSCERIALAGGCIAERQSAKFGFLDKSGKWKIAPAFDECLGFKNQMCVVKVGDKWGAIDREGRFIVPAKQEALKDFSVDGLAAFRSGKKWGYLDRSGAIAIEPKFDQVRDFCEGLAAVSISNKWGYIDKTGTFKVSCKFEEASSFSRSCAMVARSGNAEQKHLAIVFELIDKEARTLAGPFAYALSSGDGFVSCTDDFVNWKLLDNKGRLQCSFKHYGFQSAISSKDTMPILNDRIVVVLPGE